MSEDEQKFLNQRNLPAMVGMLEAGWLLGVPEHIIPVLVRSHLLDPLGAPRKNARKYFETVEILEKKKDRKWLSRVVNVVYKHWRGEKGDT